MEKTDSFGDLYKRWLMKMGLSIGGIAAATSLCFGVYAYARNLQYSATRPPRSSPSPAFCHTSSTPSRSGNPSVSNPILPRKESS